MATRDPIEVQIDRETDDRFWTLTGERGHKLDRHVAADRALINTWLRLRYDVAQEVAARNAQGIEGPMVALSGRGFHGGGGFRGGRGGYFGEMPYEERLVAIVPPVVAEAAAVHFSVQGDTLTASVTVDGRTYSGTAELSQLLHDSGGAPGDGGSGDAAVAAAGAFMIGALCEQRQQTAVAGWWHSLTHKLGNMAKDVEGGVVSTLNALKGPIAQAASMAAGAAAMAIPGAGPLLAPMAAGLAKNLVDAATGQGSVKKAAQAVVQQAQAAAQQDPQIAAALNAAHQAVASATTAYHVTQTVAQAAAGNPDAAAQVAELATAAANGDAAAQNAIDLGKAAVNTAVSNAGGGDPMPTEDTGADDASAAVQGALMCGADLDARAHANDLARRARATGAMFIGVILTPSGDFDVRKFESLDDADDWFGNTTGNPTAFSYVAYYDATAPTFPSPANEAHGAHPLEAGGGPGPAQGTHAAAASSGWFLPFLLGAGVGGGAGYYGPAVYDWARARWTGAHAPGTK